MRIALILTLSVLIGLGCKKNYKGEIPPPPPPQTTWKVCHTFEILDCEVEDAMSIMYAGKPYDSTESPSEIWFVAFFLDGVTPMVDGRPRLVGPHGEEKGDWNDYFQYTFLGDSMKICVEIPDNDTTNFTSYCYFQPDPANYWNRRRWVYVKGELVIDSIY